MENNNKLSELASSSRSSNWMELKAYKKENRKWLDRSLDIALRVLDVLQQKDMTQTELAELMSVTRQYVSRIVRGTENLTLETIAKLEEVLGVSLIDVVDENTIEQHRIQSTRQFHIFVVLEDVKAPVYSNPVTHIFNCISQSEEVFKAPISLRVQKNAFHMKTEMCSVELTSAAELLKPGRTIRLDRTLSWGKKNSEQWYEGNHVFNG